MEKVELKDMECRHRISMSNSYGTPQRVIVFIDKKANTYVWTTTAGEEFHEGRVYDIKARCDERNRLSFVKIIQKSEQPDLTKKQAVDVFDLIYNINEGSEQK